MFLAMVAYKPILLCHFLHEQNVIILFKLSGFNINILCRNARDVGLKKQNNDSV